jgi:hypothetical protein
MAIPLAQLTVPRVQSTPNPPVTADAIQAQVVPVEPPLAETVMASSAASPNAVQDSRQFGHDALDSESRPWQRSERHGEQRDIRTGPELEAARLASAEAELEAARLAFAAACRRLMDDAASQALRAAPPPEATLAAVPAATAPADQAAAARKRTAPTKQLGDNALPGTETPRAAATVPVKHGVAGPAPPCPETPQEARGGPSDLSIDVTAPFVIRHESHSEYQAMICV